MTEVARMRDAARKGWLAEVDGLRAIAYAFIVFSHAVGALRYVDHDTTSMAVFGALLAITRFSLPAFMMVSALLVGRQVATGKQPNTGRAFRGLVVPYLAWSVVYFMISKVVITGGPATTVPQLSRELVRAILTGSAFDHLWYLVVALQIVLVAPAIAQGLRRLNTADRTLVLVIVLALNIILMGQLDGPVTRAARWTSGFSGYSDRIVLYWAAYIVAGVVIGLDYERVYAFVRKRRPVLWAAYALLTVGLVILVIRQATTTGGDYAAVIDVSSVRQPWIVPYQMLAALVCLDVAGMLMKSGGRSVLEPLARTSFGGYLVHLFWLVVANQLVLSRVIAPNPFLYVTALTVFDLAASYLTVLALENMRMPAGSVFLGNARTGPTATEDEVAVLAPAAEENRSGDQAAGGMTGDDDGVAVASATL